MRKLSITFLTIVSSVFLLIGCGKNTPAAGSEIEVIESMVTNTDEITSPGSNAGTPGNSETQDDNIPPIEGMVRSKLTNDWIAPELFDQRPLAIMIPNESAALPHYGLSKASILYEANVEGRMTRMMAIIDDYASLEKIGNIRSIREYYPYWAFEWDAILCHFGGTVYNDAILAKDTTDNLNGNAINDPFFRSADRISPHNAYLDGTLVKEVLQKRNVAEKDRGLADATHFQFAMPSDPNTLQQYKEAEDASFIDMTACYPMTKCYFEYNPDDGLYYRSQHVSGGTDGPHIDGSNGVQLSFANIIIQSVDYAVRDTKGYLWIETVDSGRDAWYITKGKMIKCTWEKNSEFGATRYYDESGNEITLNTGKTMICVIEDGDIFDYE